MSQAGQVIRGVGDRLVPPLPRSEATELLDVATHDPAELAANLRDIRRVNSLLGGTWRRMVDVPPLIDVTSQRPVTILDLATGSADIPLAIGRWATRQNIPVTIVASDVSDEILDVARDHIAGQPGISFARYDARAIPLPDDAFDVVLCSLSLHHFAPDDAVRVLREMDRLARVGFVLNDLRRGRLGYVAAWIATRLTTRNRLTRNDAPLSVKRAYTPDELHDLLHRAGIDDVRITMHAWFRMAAVRAKSDA